MIAQETKEQRKERLERTRLEYRALIKDWAERVEYAATTATDEFACEIAAEVLRHASQAQVKRAVTAVRKARKERGQ